MEQLTDLPNIGPVLAEELKQVGIDTPEALREAFFQFRQYSPQELKAYSELLEALAG